MALASIVEAQTLLDFVTFDGVHYIRWADEPGRDLTRDDLGIEFATVECSVTDARDSCAFGRPGGGCRMTEQRIELPAGSIHRRPSRPLPAV